MRIGHGYDVHAFGDGDKLMLGGVSIPYHQSFIAHSDGDVLIHALIDAILGALALGDIGQHFPDTDQQWQGADSRQLLTAVVQMMNERAISSAMQISPLLLNSQRCCPIWVHAQQSLCRYQLPDGSAKY